MNENLSSAQWDVVRYTAPISYRSKKPSAREVVSSHPDYSVAWHTASKSNTRTNTAAGMTHKVEPTGWGGPAPERNEWREAQQWVGLKKQLES